MVWRLLSTSTLTLIFVVAGVSAGGSSAVEAGVDDWRRLAPGVSCDFDSGAPAKEMLTTNTTRHRAARERAKGYIRGGLRALSLAPMRRGRRTEVHRVPKSGTAWNRKWMAGSRTHPATIGKQICQAGTTRMLMSAAWGECVSRPTE